MPTSPDLGSDDALRVLHWNVQSWRDEAGAASPEAIAGVINEIDPHVVSLVEVDEAWGTPAILGELADRAGLAWIFVPAIEVGQDEPAGGYGNALLTKIPILAVQQWQLLWPPTLYDGSERSEPRTAVLAKLSAPAGPLWIGSTHLPRGDAGARTRALQRLTLLTHTLDAPWLVCGDFNTPYSSWLDPAADLVVSPNPAQPTYPTSRPVEPIDYVVASPGITVEARALATQGSDHLPVLAEAVVERAL